MKCNLRFLFAAGLFALASCAKEQTESYDTFEDQALEAWIVQHRPELADNYQSFGTSGYYLEVLDAGRPQPAVDDLGKASPENMVISDTVCWVKFDFSGRDLGGRIVLTRRASEAKLSGTFTKNTHYVPYYRFCGAQNGSLLEGTYLAMRQKQTVSEKYFEDHPDAFRNVSSREFYLSQGSHVRLYMPSRVVGGSGMTGEGGYEGQYSLSSGKPLIVEMEIVELVKNPLAFEGDRVDGFCRDNGGVQVYVRQGDEGTADGVTRPWDREHPDHPYNVAAEWVSACDSVPQLYADFRFRPGDRPVAFPEPYAVGYEPYAAASSVAALDDRIAAALKKRFHDDAGVALYDHVKNLDADTVGLDGTAKIWYIGRFLDGFIFDTNIDEVKELIYDAGYEAGSALEYKPEDGGMIQAFYYTVPHLKYGQWAALVTTSTNAYGAAGRTGSTTTSSTSTSNGYTSSYYDYINYLNYANSYYGSGYGGYYGGYYGNYYGGYYDPYYGSGYGYDYDYGSGSDDTTVTTTSISTEIPPFTPLLFQLYIEPAE